MRNELIRNLKKLLFYHQSLGIEHYPVSEDLKHFLAAAEQPQDPSRRSIRPQTSTGGEPEQHQAPAHKFANLADVRSALASCARCRLHNNRANLVFDAGNPQADLFIVGEWPDWEDDSSNQPFSGAKGELLEKMLQAIQLSRDSVYLTNIVKCRATEENPPSPEEIRACLPFLREQIALVNPRVLCTMGPLAAQVLLATNKPLVRLRGRFYDYQGIPVMPTFHPSYLLKTPELKKAAWIDLQLIQKKLLKT